VHGRPKAVGARARRRSEYYDWANFRNTGVWPPGQCCAPRKLVGMAISILTDPKTSAAKIRFVLPDDVHDGPVSAVGTFNNWTPGKHKLVRRANGTRSVTLTVEPGQEVRFRYLGSGGRWFDDPEVSEISADGAVVRV
jgi:hypothetical protein